MNEPRPKKFCKLKPAQPLPILENNRKFEGVFDEFSIVIENEQQMREIISMGYFGKANLSRNYPQFQKNSGIIRKRVFLHRKKLGGKAVPRKVIVIPDSSDSDEDYFNKLKPIYEMDRTGIKENVRLNLEEAFFLASPINCLNIHYQDKILTPKETWELFAENDRFFIQNYIAYYHFRAKNWVVKPGIKFGGDFVLYKQGPPFYHASYVVIIDIVDETFKRIDHLTRRSMNAVALTGLNRLCETAGKELVICQIMWPSVVNYEDFSNITIKTIIMKRWLSSQERQIDVN